MPQTPSNQDNNAHALLIGVNCYKSFEGNHDLEGSLHDVLILASYLVEVLGIPLENIVALTTPKLTDDDLEQHPSLRGITTGDANEKEVTKGFASLLATKGTALLTFSGHGAALPGGEPVLCLGDTAKDFTSGVLPLKTLRDDIEKAYAEDRLIALLDCCHVRASSTAQRRLLGTSSTAQRKRRATSLPHTVATEDVAKQEDSFRVSDRVLLAAQPGMEAYQMRLGRVWHGALTFALVTAADRWKGENEMSHGSYKQVVKRAKLTLKALDVPQTSELRVPDARWVKIRKDPFLGVKSGPTQEDPDAPREGLQLDPDYYTIKVDGAVLAEIMATGDTDVYVSFNGSISVLPHLTESWYVNDSALRNLQNASQVTITRSDIPATTRTDPFVVSSDFTSTFPSAEAATWSREIAIPPDGVNYTFTGTPGTPSNTTAYLLLNVTTGQTGAFSLTGVQWYLTGLANTPSPESGDLQPSSSGTGTVYTTAVPPTTDYYAARTR